jgi:hypothetical protein
MKITRIFSSLVPPGKHGDPDAPEPILGTEVALQGNLFKMLSDVYAKSDEECNIPIRFLMAEDGTQQNEVRTALVELIQHPSLDGANTLGSRLRDVTNLKSGMGLLFFVLGSAGDSNKVVISRFPADQGILAEAHETTLDVEFVERIFMKNQATYKAAVYRGKSLKSDFWDGMVVDHQALIGHSASYWIRDFLRSDFKTTAQAGSMRLAIALREASKAAPSLVTKQQIISAMTLAPGLANRTVVPRELFDRFGFSDETKETVSAKFPNKATLDAAFALDAEEFRRHAKFRSVELDTGAILTAPAERFDEAFERKTLNQQDGLVRFTATGHVTNEKITRRA